MCRKTRRADAVECVTLRRFTTTRHAGQRSLPINLQLRELSQLFNSMNPSPFQDRDCHSDITQEHPPDCPADRATDVSGCQPLNSSPAPSQPARALALYFSNP